MHLLPPKILILLRNKKGCPSCDHKKSYIFCKIRLIRTYCYAHLAHQIQNFPKQGGAAPCNPQIVYTYIFWQKGTEIVHLWSPKIHILLRKKKKKKKSCPLATTWNRIFLFTLDRNCAFMVSQNIHSFKKKTNKQTNKQTRGGPVKLDSMWQHRLTRPLHVQHTYYRIIFKQNPFNIISRGIQRWTSTDFRLK